MEVRIAVFSAAGAAIAAAAAWALLRRRPSPDQLERERRMALHSTGRIGDAIVTEASAGTLFYTYSIRGVQYQASQDIGPFLDRLPADLERLAGPAAMKYSLQNPANSMLISEEWSGLRKPDREIPARPAALAHRTAPAHPGEP